MQEFLSPPQAQISESCGCFQQAQISIFNKPKYLNLVGVFSKPKSMKLVGVFSKPKSMKLVGVFSELWCF